MKTLLAVLVLMLIGTQTFSIDASLAPGLSLKNAMLYVAAIVVVARMVVSGGFRPQLAGLQVAFIFLIVYAVLSLLVVAFVVRYPGYVAIDSAIVLKNGLIDYAVFFVVFFYGLQTAEDALAVANAFLVGVVVANVITVLDASGVLGLNVIAVRTFDVEDYGRVQGAFGEANQHAAVVAMVLPAMCAKVLLSRGFWRIPWVVGVGFGIAVVFMTASRGAMVGLVLGALWGAVVFRRYVSLGSVALWVAGAAAMIGVVLLAVSDNYVELLTERVVGLTLSGNVADASSGRSAIWGEILNRMMGSPWSFITGFGWNAYSVMDFEYAAHNTYLGLWFNLGLPGVLAFCAVLFQAISAGVRAAEAATAELRPMFIAFSVGFLALCISIFFVELFIPWLYVWAYLGLMMRAAVSVTSAAAPAAKNDDPPERKRPTARRPSRRQPVAVANGRHSSANR